MFQLVCPTHVTRMPRAQILLREPTTVHVIRGTQATVRTVWISMNVTGVTLATQMPTVRTPKVTTLAHALMGSLETEDNVQVITHYILSHSSLSFQ